MENETIVAVPNLNQPIVGIHLHDIIAITKHQNVNEDGTKAGYSWYESTTYGVVTVVDGDRLEYLDATKKAGKYNVAEQEQDYHYSITKVSEITFRQAIETAITEKETEIIKIEKERDYLIDWAEEFERSVAFLSKLERWFTFRAK